jgi:hypothetical protein
MPFDIERSESSPTLVTATASTDSISAVVINSSEVAGCSRQRRIFSRDDSVASKNSGSYLLLKIFGNLGP